MIDKELLKELLVKAIDELSIETSDKKQIACRLLIITHLANLAEQQGIEVTF